MDSSDRGVMSAGRIEESLTVAAMQDGHFAESPRHDRILTLLRFCPLPFCVLCVEADDDSLVSGGQQDRGSQVGGRRAEHEPGDPQNGLDAVTHGFRSRSGAP